MLRLGFCSVICLVWKGYFNHFFLSSSKNISPAFFCGWVSSWYSVTIYFAKLGREQVLWLRVVLDGV